jgi:CDP-2,3-bis-(O-geranylgeranyl)-sn-glycerol synthase
MQYLSILQLLALITLANGSPVVAKRILGQRLAQPLDGNIKFVDGRPLFGASKTARGIVVSILVTSAGAPLMGLPLEIGLVVAITAMTGDLLSSFVKRRFGLAPSSKLVGLDQVPESLFPLLACREVFSLTVLDIASGTVLFVAGELLLSPLLFRLRIRDRPY